MALATLSIDLVAKIANFEKDLGQAARAAQKNADAIQGAFNKVQGAVATVIGGAAVGSLGALFQAQVDVIDGFNDLSDATSASIENLSGLEELGRRTGTSFDTVGGILIKFNNALKEAKDDNDAGQVFKALGLNFRQLREMDPTDALRATAVALEGFATNTTKANYVSELFGKSIREAAPFLKDLAEGGQLAGKVTSEQAAAAERLNKQLFEMKANAEDLRRELANELIPVLSRMLENFKGIRELGSMDLIFKDAARSLFTMGDGKLGGDPGEQINKLLANRTKLEEQLALAQNARGRRNESYFSDLEKEIATENRYLAVLRLRQRTAILGDQQGDASDAMSRRLQERLPKLPKLPGGPAKESAAAKLQEEIATRLSAAYATIQNPLEDLTAAEQFAIKVVTDLADAKNKLTDAEKRRISSQLEQYLLVAKQAEIDKATAKSTIADAQRIATERQAVRNKEYADILEFQRNVSRADEEMVAELLKNTPGVKLENDRRVQQMLADKFLAGRFGDPQSIEAMRTYGEVAQTALGNLSQVAAETENAFASLGPTFASAAEDILVKGGEAREVVAGLAQDIARIFLRKTFTEPAGDWLVKQFAGFSLTKLFPFAEGGVMTAQGPLPLRRYAAGGVASSPQLAMYGEGSTPEAFVPLPDGRRIPVAMKGGGGGNIVVQNNTFHVDTATRGDVERAIRASERRIASAARRSRDYGGEFQ